MAIQSENSQFKKFLSNIVQIGQFNEANDAQGRRVFYRPIRNLDSKKLQELEEKLTAAELEFTKGQNQFAIVASDHNISAMTDGPAKKNDLKKAARKVVKKQPNFSFQEFAEKLKSDLESKNPIISKEKIFAGTDIDIKFPGEEATLSLVRSANGYVDFHVWDYENIPFFRLNIKYDDERYEQALFLFTYVLERATEKNIDSDAKKLTDTTVVEKKSEPQKKFQQGENKVKVTEAESKAKKTTQNLFRKLDEKLNKYGL